MNYSGLHRLDEEETPVDEQPTMEVKPSQLPPPRRRRRRRLAL